MYRVIAAILCVAAIFGAQQTITMPFGRASEVHGQLPLLKSRTSATAPHAVKQDFQPSFTSRAFLVSDPH
jgi:hypothetical protein